VTRWSALNCDSDDAYRYPDRPRNHSQTLLFSELFKSLFDPLNENKRQPSGPAIARKKVGPNGPHKLSPNEQRRHIIERFIARWRREVGDDFYPALRLILPDKDRDRGVYGLKENTIGRLLVKILKIDKNSEDGYNLLHWKLPGQTTASRMAGDFAGRCFEVLSKRQMRVDAGDMRIAEVNELLDRLAGANGEAEQTPIFETFYQRMSAEELMWLIRIILKQMKVGATERTFLDLWHPDGEALFSVSSSLRRVCWELWDPEFRLEQESTGVALMQCFQPQLAQFQIVGTFQKMVDKLVSVPDEDPEFWIEEKLDGERMQMHMEEDEDTPGGMKFKFWSRKAKEYTYLYGSGFEDETSALTRFLKDAFHEGVRNLILDGEMITWNMDSDKIVAFGTLKTAALDEQKNQSHSNKGSRPLLRVFDILYLNDQPLTKYTLRDRHNALEQAVKGVHRRLEVHPFEKATSADAIEPQLRRVVAEASEGLVLKNPRSMYRLNSRNDDWIKVKPEYMSEFGESLDCVVIAGYYGSGRRGGTLSSFMCGLRVSENYIRAGADREKCFSFFKVGGGFRAEDYAAIHHQTEGKWKDWDRANPPSKYIELGGGEKYQYEKPDVWIRPSESVVISVKAASVGQSDSFAMGVTLRFPRFKKLRLDRAWDSALDVDDFNTLKDRFDEEAREKQQMTMDDRRKRASKRVKREVVIAGAEDGEAEAEFASAPGSASKAKIFEGMEFSVLSEALRPIKKSKVQLEALIKENGGKVSQRAEPNSGMVLIADKKVVKVASLIKVGKVDIIKPKWLFDCLAQDDGFLLPYEPCHLFHATEATKKLAAESVDIYGDSYARDVTVDELRALFRDMHKIEGEEEDGLELSAGQFLEQLEDAGDSLGNLKGRMFARCKIYFARGADVRDGAVLQWRNYAVFGGADIAADVKDESVTHIVIVTTSSRSEREVAAKTRAEISSRKTVPRIVTHSWIQDSWWASTRVDEEKYTPL
jgi:DNA ligase 4